MSLPYPTRPMGYVGRGMIIAVVVSVVVRCYFMSVRDNGHSSNSTDKRIRWWLRDRRQWRRGWTTSCISLVPSSTSLSRPVVSLRSIISDVLLRLSSPTYTPSEQFSPPPPSSTTNTASSCRRKRLHRRSWSLPPGSIPSPRFPHLHQHADPNLTAAAGTGSSSPTQTKPSLIDASSQVLDPTGMPQPQWHRASRKQNDIVQLEDGQLGNSRFGHSRRDRIVALVLVLICQKVQGQLRHSATIQLRPMRR
mmetsp:Transcript_33439/g.72355  ORF Transcript_33439/g.72355 Transcript_33439/m.72355 type:complete len:250 (-) Transcript_33439:171-920(-)